MMIYKNYMNKNVKISNVMLGESADAHVLR